MDSKESAPKPKHNKGFTLTIDYRLLSVVLGLVIIAMLAFWRPWEFRPTADNRTVSAAGSATVKATPDEFIFTPSYEFKAATKDAVLKELSAKSDEIVKKLKSLGVADNKIKTNTDGYDSPIYGYEGESYGQGGPDEGDGTSSSIAPTTPRDTRPTYTLRVTITVNNKDLAQKVQDYVVSTSPTGAVSPQVGFSKEKAKELANKAREIASKEARANAEQSAKNLGFRLGPVKRVDDGAGFSGVQPALNDTAVSRLTEAPETKLSLQPGENDLEYYVYVTYYIK